MPLYDTGAPGISHLEAELWATVEQHGQCTEEGEGKLKETHCILSFMKWPGKKNSLFHVVEIR